MTGTPATDPIVAFYSGGRDDRGRTIEQILAWDDDALEAVHDYIQWLFPLRRPSGVNPDAPLVTDVTARAFGADTRLTALLRRTFERMLHFYGLRAVPGAIEPDPVRFAARARVWLHPGNHNHLRLTRIMASLAALGLRDEASALQRCLIDRVALKPDSVSARTLHFWRRALDEG